MTIDWYTILNDIDRKRERRRSDRKLSLYRLRH